MTPDRIERELLISAPVERVWAVLTEPQHVGVWFGQGEPVAVDLRPGGIMMIDHGEHGSFPTLIEKVDPPNYFAYRWASAYPGEPATEQNSTLVEFTLIPEDGQTRLKLTESGFATAVMPATQDRSDLFESHSTGWTGVLEAFTRRLAQP
jgi:uncharacterized protein YndB with AHSA1/START domain